MKTLGAVGHLIAEKTDAKERATIKGAEIAKLGPLPRRNVKFSGADFDIEIVALNPIQGGVEVYARAWRPDGEQIGFGFGGGVDIERFRIFNPPVMVPDGTQTLTEDPLGNPRLVDNFKEDPEAAILQSLAHTISVKKEKYDSRNIVPGLVGNTTSTFYPDADPESTSVDGRVIRTGQDVAWATIRGAADGTFAGAADGAENDMAAIQASTTSNQWAAIRRSIFLFDTSALPDTDTISAATFSIYGFSVTDNFNQGVSLVSSAPATNTALVVGDYSTLGTTKFATDVDMGSWSTTGYNDWALNAAGIAAIAKAGITKYGIRVSGDCDDAEPTWGSGQKSTVGGYYADNAGTSNDPKLVVEHSAPVTTLNLSENLSTSIIERITRAWTAPRSQSEILALQGESTTRTWNAPRSPIDVITITETFSGVKGRIIELLETLGINESFARSWSAGRSLSESVGITETFTRVANYVRGLIETQTIIEYLTASVQIIRTLVLSELVTIIEHVRTPLNWLKRTKPTTLWTPRTKP